MIPDSHALPEYDNYRYELAGRFAEERQPTYIVNIGDHYDMPSASSYMGEESAEAQIADIDEDIACGDEAWEIFEGAYKGNAKRHFTLGNHEARLDQLGQQRARFRRPLSSQMCCRKPRELGWVCHAYGQVIDIESIAIAHNMVSGTMGRPIGGEMLARTLILKGMESCIVGHSHTLMHYEMTSVLRRKLFGLSVGCFTHKDFGKRSGRSIRDKYAARTNHMWWNGLIFIDGLDGKGYYDRIEFITQRELAREISGEDSPGSARRSRRA